MYVVANVARRPETFAVVVGRLEIVPDPLPAPLLASRAHPLHHRLSLFVFLFFLSCLRCRRVCSGGALLFGDSCVIGQNKMATVAVFPGPKHLFQGGELPPSQDGEGPRIPPGGVNGRILTILARTVNIPGIESSIFLARCPYRVLRVRH